MKLPLRAQDRPLPDSCTNALDWARTLESKRDEVHPKDLSKFIKSLENSKIAVLGVRGDRTARGLPLETEGL